jgi:hypothetical protein
MYTDLQKQIQVRNPYWHLMACGDSSESHHQAMRHSNERFPTCTPTPAIRSTMYKEANRSGVLSIARCPLVTIFIRLTKDVAWACTRHDVSERYIHSPSFKWDGNVSHPLLLQPIFAGDNIVKNAWCLFSLTTDARLYRIILIASATSTFRISNFNFECLLRQCAMIKLTTDNWQEHLWAPVFPDGKRFFRNNLLSGRLDGLKWRLMHLGVEEPLIPTNERLK